MLLIIIIVLLILWALGYTVTPTPLGDGATAATF